MNDHRNEPTYWFAVLEIARARSDFERAAEAQQELKRLGVSVRYTRSLANRTEGREAVRRG
ncbi:MAG TPA: hypothetical protein VMG10_33455 [Gemmataceae bacterium]|nr:hypothetical protein [Gemmataceae bacterium]